VVEVFCLFPRPLPFHERIQAERTSYRKGTITGRHGKSPLSLKDTITESDRKETILLPLRGKERSTGLAILILRKFPFKYVYKFGN
jgi:hypothetical protein